MVGTTAREFRRSPRKNRHQFEEEDRSSLEMPALASKATKKERDWRDDLVGIPIRKKGADGSWRNGIIVSVKSYVKVKYRGTTEMERIPIGEALELWMVAHQMYKIPSLLPHRRNPFLFQRGRNSKPYSLSQFIELLHYAEQAHGGASIEELEASKLVEKKPNSNTSEIYGRMLPGATDKIFREFMNLQSMHTLIDIGHGIGNSCLQAAYTVGCTTRGIECHKTRNYVSQVLALRLEDAVQIHKERDKMKFTPGSISFRHGDLQDYKHRKFLTKDITHIFFDNWNGVFNGERGNYANLERYVAAWFAASPEGTIMITVSPLRSALGCLPLKEAILARQKLGLPIQQATDASFYEVEEFDLGPVNEVYSFAAGVADPNMKPQICCYLYLRTHQQSEGASFLCNNPQCKKAMDATPVEAIHYEEIKRKGKVEKAAVIGGCDCGISDRVLRMRY